MLPSNCCHGDASCCSRCRRASHSSALADEAYAWSIASLLSTTSDAGFRLLMTAFITELSLDAKSAVSRVFWPVKHFVFKSPPPQMDRPIWQDSGTAAPPPPPLQVNTYGGSVRLSLDVAHRIHAFFDNYIIQFISRSPQLKHHKTHNNNK